VGEIPEVDQLREPIFTQIIVEKKSGARFAFVLHRSGTDIFSVLDILNMR